MWCPVVAIYAVASAEDTNTGHDDSAVSSGQAGGGQTSRRQQGDSEGLRGRVWFGGVFSRRRIEGRGRRLLGGVWLLQAVLEMGHGQWSVGKLHQMTMPARHTSTRRRPKLMRTPRHKRI